MNLERELKRFVRLIRPGLIGATADPNVNLAQVIEELKSSPQRCEALQAALSEFLISREFTTALTESGLTLEAGVFKEIYKRLEYKILPKATDHLDILSFISRIFDSPSDSAWLEDIDRQLLDQFFDLIMPARESLLGHLSPQLFMSLEILSLRLAGLGYDPLVTHRLKMRPEFQHCFMDVTRRIHLLLEGDSGHGEIAPIREALKRSLESIAWIRSRRSIDGASLGLTYRLMKIEQIVQRMQTLLRLIECILVQWQPEPARDLFLDVTLAEIRQFELRRFFGGNAELLAFQITEHTGKTGEHYITRTRSEWMQMARSAALGGMIVALLAVLKTLGSKLNLPPGPDAILNGTLYAIGFLVINALGGTLATKQPAMTAARLAAALDEAKNSMQAMQNLAEIIIRTIRSQLIALFGNFLIAFPVAAVISIPWIYINFPLMSPAKAWATMDSLHPLLSLSWWYAALTGVLLFISGLIAGFADNWFVFNNVGVRLKQSELLRRMVGAHNLDRAIQKIDHGLGIWAGNISLGFFLGGAAALGQIMGLPLDVRHITFSSATFGIAMTSVKFDVGATYALLIGISIFVMGLLNLTVSFSLSLFVAVKSRRIRFSQTPQLLKILGHRLLHRPLEFLVPPA